MQTSDSMFVTITNKSSTDVDKLTLSSLRLDSIFRQTESFSLVVGKKRRVQLNAEAQIWKLSISKRDYTGLKFDARTVDDGCRVETYVTHGDHLEIIDDPRNPFLSVVEVKEIARSIQSIFEKNCVALNRQSLFQKVCETFYRTPSQLGEAFNGNVYARTLVNDTPWENLYRPVRVPRILNAEKVRLMYESEPLQLHVYFRALDHRMHRKRHNLVVHMNTMLADGKSHPINVVQYTGTGSSCDCGNRHELRTTQMSSPGDSNRLLDLVLQHDAIDSEYFVRPHSSIPDLSNNEWSSIEVLLFAPSWCPEIHSACPRDFKDKVRALLFCNNRSKCPLDTDCLYSMIKKLFELEKIAPIPVFRLHQRCSRVDRYDQQHSTSRKSRHFMESVKDFLGMENVANWGFQFHSSVKSCPAKDRCTDLFERHFIKDDDDDDRESQGDNQTGWILRGSYFPPIYFRH